MREPSVPRNKATLGLMLLITGCANQATTQAGREQAAVDPATAACAQDLAGSSPVESLNPDDIGIVNWNIQKGGDPRWADDLAGLVDSTDLMILQEASPRLEALRHLAPDHFHAFAPGYHGNGFPTGALTASSVTPVTECDLVSHEPWLGTRKATLITEYGLSGTDDTLLVVNIHGVNFSFGMRELERQFRQAEAIISLHAGPVLFSGDFNTWRGARAALLADVVGSLGLNPLEYEEDHRKRFRGWAARSHLRSRATQCEGDDAGSRILRPQPDARKAARPGHS